MKKPTIVEWCILKALSEADKPLSGADALARGRKIAQEIIDGKRSAPDLG